MIGTALRALAGVFGALPSVQPLGAHRAERHRGVLLARRHRPAPDDPRRLRARHRRRHLDLRAGARRVGSARSAGRVGFPTMPPSARPFPRFIADASQDAEPAGRWAERLTDALRRGVRAARRRCRLGSQPGDAPLVSRARLGRARLRAGDGPRAGAVGSLRRARGLRARPRRVLRLGLVRAARGRRALRLHARRPTSPTSPSRTAPSGRSTSPTT